MVWGTNTSRVSIVPKADVKDGALKRYIKSNRHQYNTDGLDDAQKIAYLARLSPEQFGRQALADRKAGFDSWLSGTSEHNLTMEEYVNKPGYRRRRTMRGQHIPDGGTGFYPTNWGRKQLTDLPGVRSYLRAGVMAADKEDMRLQILAHMGPHDLPSAWEYYNAWVDAHPLDSPAPEVNTGGWLPETDYVGDTHFGPIRSAAGSAAPDGGPNMPDFGGGWPLTNAVERDDVIAETRARLGGPAIPGRNPYNVMSRAQISSFPTPYVQPSPSVLPYDAYIDPAELEVARAAATAAEAEAEAEAEAGAMAEVEVQRTPQTPSTPQTPAPPARDSYAAATLRSVSSSGRPAGAPFHRTRAKAPISRTPI